MELTMIAHGLTEAQSRKNTQGHSDPSLNGEVLFSVHDVLCSAPANDSFWDWSSPFSKQPFLVQIGLIVRVFFLKWLTLE